MPHLLTLLNLAWISKVSFVSVCDATNLTYGTSLSGAVITPARISNEISSSDGESVPLPLEVAIPKERLPDVLDVYDKDAILIVPAGDPTRMAEYRSWEKFLARGPVKFVRKYPVRIPTTLEGEGMFIPALPSSPLYPHTQRWLVTCRKPRPTWTSAQ